MDAVPIIRAGFASNATPALRAIRNAADGRSQTGSGGADRCGTGAIERATNRNGVAIRSLSDGNTTDRAGHDGRRCSGSRPAEHLPSREPSCLLHRVRHESPTSLRRGADHPRTRGIPRFMPARPRGLILPGLLRLSDSVKTGASCPCRAGKDRRLARRCSGSTVNEPDRFGEHLLPLAEIAADRFALGRTGNSRIAALQGDAAVLVRAVARAACAVARRWRSSECGGRHARDDRGHPYDGTGCADPLELCGRRWTPRVERVVSAARVTLRSGCEDVRSDREHGSSSASSVALASRRARIAGRASPLRHPTTRSMM